MSGNYQEDIEKIKNDILSLSSRPAAETGPEWRALAVRVNALCAQITRADPGDAHAVLPALGAVIQVLDQMIPEAEG